MYLIDMYERMRPVLRLLGGSIVHFFVAALIALIVGGVAAHLFTGRKIEQFFLAVELLSGLLAGFSQSAYLLGGTGAPWAWVVGAVPFLNNMHELASFWSPVWAPTARWDYVTENMFSPSRCSETECLYMAFGTLPFVASIGYSLGALLRRVRTRASG